MSHNVTKRFVSYLIENFAQMNPKNITENIDRIEYWIEDTFFSQKRHSKEEIYIKVTQQIASKN